MPSKGRLDPGGRQKNRFLREELSKWSESDSVFHHSDDTWTKKRREYFAGWWTSAQAGKKIIIKKLKNEMTCTILLLVFIFNRENTFRSEEGLFFLPQETVRVQRVHGDHKKKKGGKWADGARETLYQRWNCMRLRAARFKEKKLPIIEYLNYWISQ